MKQRFRNSALIERNQGQCFDEKAAPLAPSNEKVAHFLPYDKH